MKGKESTHMASELFSDFRCLETILQSKNLTIIKHKFNRTVTVRTWSLDTWFFPFEIKWTTSSSLVYAHANILVTKDCLRMLLLCGSWISFTLPSCSQQLVTNHMHTSLSTSPCVPLRKHKKVCFHRGM